MVSYFPHKGFLYDGARSFVTLLSMITWLSRFDSRKLVKLKSKLTPDAYNNSQCKSDSSVMHIECTYTGLMWWVYTVMNIYCSCIALATAKDSPERSVRIHKKLNESPSWSPNHRNILVISWDTWHPLEENAHAPSRTSSTVLVWSLFEFYQVPTRCRGLSSSVNRRKFSGDQNYIDVRWLWNEKELKLTPPTTRHVSNFLSL